VQPRNRDTPSGARTALIRATCELVADGGTRAVSAAAVCDAARMSHLALEACFGNVATLVDETNRFLCLAPVFTAAEASSASRSVNATLARLTDQHRSFVDVWPARFAAIMQFASTALFDAPGMLPPIADRNRRERRAATGHFLPLRARGAIDGSIDVISTVSLFVDTLAGIEMCFLIDGDRVLRASAYRETVQLFERRLPARMAD
jgi:hypothetical protein